MTRALLTNDDGIDAPGLHALAAGAREIGLDVVVAAPVGEASGAGAGSMAVQHDGQVAVTRRELPGLDGVAAYAVDAQPAFIVFAAVNGWLDEPPDLVLSGINAGANLGLAIVHSGTVGAAITGGRFGIRSLAVSLDTDLTPAGDRLHWDSAAAQLPRVLDLLGGAPGGTVLSLNVPNLPVAELGELRAASLATRGRVRARVDDVAGRHLRVRMVDPEGVPEPGSDTALLIDGHPTLTAVHSVRENDELRLAELLAAGAGAGAVPPR